MNELTNKRPNGQTNQRILSLTNESINNWINKWMSDDIIMIKQIPEPTTNYVTNERTHEQTNQPTNYTMNKRTNERTFKNGKNH